MPVVDPTATYLHLADGGGAATVPVPEDFWQTIADRTDLHDGRLVCAFDQTGDFPHWEMHPAGDELIVAITGRYTLIVDGEPNTPLAAGQVAVVAKGKWHRLTAQEVGRTLFVTPGKGTQVKPIATD